MQFISVRGGSKLNFRPAFTEVTKTSVGSIPKLRRGIWIEFEPLLDGGFETELLPAKYGRAQGKLDTADISRKTRVPEEEIIDFLLNHPRYGDHFVAVDEDGSGLSLDDIDPQKVGLHKPDGSVYCKACDRVIPNKQGWGQHIKAKKHLDNVKEMT